MEGVDALCGLLNLAPDDLGDELGGQLAERAGLALARHDVHHLLSDRPDLRAGGVCRLLDLVRPSLGEGDAEHADLVVIDRVDGHVGLDERLPLAHQRAELVGCKVESVEVGQAVAALDLVDPQLDLAECLLLVLLQIGERRLENSALEGIVGVLQTGRSVDKSLADTGLC